MYWLLDMPKTSSEFYWKWIYKCIKDGVGAENVNKRSAVILKPKTIWIHLGIILISVANLSHNGRLF